MNAVDFFNASTIQNHSKNLNRQDKHSADAEEAEADFSDLSMESFHSSGSCDESLSEEDLDYQPTTHYSLRSLAQPSKPPKRSKAKKVNAPPAFSYFYQINADIEIIGREKEARQVAAMLLAGIQPLILGPKGIGKMSLVIKTSQLFKNTLPISASKTFYCLDCQELISEHAEENLGEEIIGHLKGLMAKHVGAQPHSVVYFRNIDKLMDQPQVGDYLLSLFRQSIPLIASISEDVKEEKTSQTISQLNQYNFACMHLPESPLADCYKIVERHLEDHPIKNVTYTKKAIELATRLAAKHFAWRPMPIKAINVLKECGTQWMLDSLIERKQTGAKITESEVAAFVSSKCGIPPDDLLEDSIFHLQRFAEKLKGKVVGQDYAIEAIAQRVASWKMGLLNPHQPWGIYLFVGPTGVGKTELAKQLAKQLFYNEGSLLILDGSEYKESHTASNLVGAPRGYEGHQAGGMLTGPLLENPYQVVLFDEFEKAHDDVRKLFLQVFDQGRLTDRRGKTADCSKALFLLTSNLGSTELFSGMADSQISHEELIQSLKPILVEHLSPEMCGRFTEILPFTPLSQENLPKLVEVQLLKMKDNLSAQAGINLRWTSSLLTRLSTIDADLRFGGRQFCALVSRHVEQAIRELFIKHQQRLTGDILLKTKSDGSIIAVKPQFKI